jgi:hypothetical protein
MVHIALTAGGVIAGASFEPRKFARRMCPFSNRHCFSERLVSEVNEGPSFQNFGETE